MNDTFMKEKPLLGPGLSFLQKPCRLFAGTEQL